MIERVPGPRKLVIGWSKKTKSFQIFQIISDVDKVTFRQTILMDKINREAWH